MQNVECYVRVCSTKENSLPSSACTGITIIGRVTFALLSLFTLGVCQLVFCQ